MTRDTKRIAPMFATALAALVALFAFTGAYAQSEAVEKTFEASDGTTIHYQVQGRGDPIVLLHGITSSGDSNWRATGIIDRLAEEFQVIAVDQRGHGQSGKPHDPAMYGEQMARDVVELLNHMKLQQTNVIGYSMGGYITMKLVALAPDRLMSAVVAGAGWPHADLRDQNLFDDLAGSLETGKGVGPLVELLWPAEQPPTPEQLQAMGNMMLGTNDPMALAAVVRGMAGLDVSAPLLRVNQVPILNIIGSEDPLKPSADALVGVMGDHRLHVIEGANHLTTLLNPEFFDTVRAFLIELCNCA